MKSKERGSVLHSEAQEGNTTHKHEVAPQERIKHFYETTKEKLQAFFVALAETKTQTTKLAAEVGTDSPLYSEVKALVQEEESLAKEMQTESTVLNAEMETWLAIKPRDYLGTTAEAFALLPVEVQAKLKNDKEFIKDNLNYLLSEKSLDEAIQWADAAPFRIHDKIVDYASRRMNLEDLLKVAEHYRPSDDLEKQGLMLILDQPDKSSQQDAIRRLAEACYSKRGKSINGTEYKLHTELFGGSLQLLVEYLNLPPRLQNPKKVASTAEYLYTHFFKPEGDHVPLDPARNFNEQVDSSYPGLARVLDQLTQKLTDSQSAESRIVRSMVVDNKLDRQFTKDAWRQEGEEQKVITRLLEMEKLNPQLTPFLYKNQGIRNVHNYPLSLLIKQYELRDTDTPYGLLMSGTVDHNASSGHEGPVWESLDAQAADVGMTLRIIEAASAKELYTRLKFLDKKYGAKNKISFGVLSGHGTPKSVQLGFFSQHARVGVSQTELRFAERAKTFFKQNFPFVFVSCSTGKEGEVAPIAEQYASALENTATAPVADTSIKEIKLDHLGDRLSLEPVYNKAVPARVFRAAGGVTK